MNNCFVAKREKETIRRGRRKKEERSGKRDKINRTMENYLKQCQKRENKTSIDFLGI